MSAGANTTTALVALPFVVLFAFAALDDPLELFVILLMASLSVAVFGLWVWLAIKVGDLVDKRLEKRR